MLHETTVMQLESASPIAPESPQTIDAGLVRRSWRRLRRDPLTLVAVVVLCGAVIACAFAPVLTLQDPNATDLSARLVPVGSAGHLLGTDALGRDLLARLIYGGRISLLAAFIPTIATVVIGGALGIIAGYFRRWQDFTISRLLDTVMSFPYILLAIAVGTVLGAGIENSMIAISVVSVPIVARLVRADVLSIARSDYIRAAHGFGASHLSIIFRHIVPNTVTLMTVYGTLQLGQMIIASSGLSFLGLGVRPPMADWGGLLAEGQAVIGTAPHVATVAGLTIFVVVMAVNLIGEALRDVLDPRYVQK